MVIDIIYFIIYNVNRRLGRSGFAAMLDPCRAQNFSDRQRGPKEPPHRKMVDATVEKTRSAAAFEPGRTRASPIFTLNPPQGSGISPRRRVCRRQIGLPWRGSRRCPRARVRAHKRE